MIGNLAVMIQSTIKKQITGVYKLNLPLADRAGLLTERIINRLFLHTA